MASYSFKAFQWTGTGYNATYTTSVTAEFNDNDAAYQGSADADETVSINGGAAGSTSGSPYVIKIGYTTADGDSFVEDFQFFNTGGNWYFAPSESSQFTEGSTLGNYVSHTTGWTYDDVVCFASGTLISTPSGMRRIEDLKPGDHVMTAEGRPIPLCWTMSRHFGVLALARNPKLRPIRIRAGALGSGLPLRDLAVSRQHRMQLVGPDGHTGLIAAHRLIDLPGVDIDCDLHEVTYHHLLFNDHEVILAEGAPSESLFLGPETLKTLPDEAKAEITDILGQLPEGIERTMAQTRLAGPILTGRPAPSDAIHPPC